MTLFLQLYFVIIIFYKSSKLNEFINYYFFLNILLNALKNNVFANLRLPILFSHAPTLAAAVSPFLGLLRHLQSTKVGNTYHVFCLGTWN